MEPKEGTQARPDGSHHYPTGSRRLSRRELPSWPNLTRNAGVPKASGRGQVMLGDELFSFLI